MNNYELMVIFTPVLSEEDYKAVPEKISLSLLKKMVVKYCTKIPGD